ncbi:glycosyltransferase [Gordonia aichiensis]|uniref:Putative glycosyltransferase n=1 Tax=Gordonia aichiensis NBRC 108223 TaxID=1220583 RepID=L7KNK6_9ACTN|nr:glycosyltransferase family 2 protein [Gordonia aichiensis]GAC50076.1 putative glycosyltransferase [Gordonia aichiensis NBRC 108223]
MSRSREGTRLHQTRVGQCVVAAGTALSVACLALTVDNARRIRVPDPNLDVEAEPLWVLLPVRDEAADVADCVLALREAASQWPGPARIVVLDDASSDDTPAIVADLATHEETITLLSGSERPPGWLGKPWACAQLAEYATTRQQPGGVLVFVDADVRLQPHALRATVATMRAAGLDLFCPYPKQEVSGVVERLIQPLLQWSWMSTLPLGLAERSPRPSLSAANGQFLAVDADRYASLGGHGAVRDQVLEDIALLRAVKAAGGRGVVGDGSAVASCRMYTGWREVHAGYRKSLWSAFGSPSGAAAVMSLLVIGYVIPSLAALRGSRTGLVGYLAGVASRIVTARRTGGRSTPDALAHPLSVLALAAATADSVLARRRGVLRWKGRPVQV